VALDLVMEVCTSPPFLRLKISALGLLSYCDEVGVSRRHESFQSRFFLTVHFLKPLIEKLEFFLPWRHTQSHPITETNFMAAQTRLDSPKQYTVAWIAALEHELAAATAVLDEEHDTPANFKRPPRDHNAYTWGRIGDHNVVIASLSAGQYGTTAAALTAEALLSSLPHIRFGLMVGIGAGVSQVERGGADVRLGDIIVSQPHETSGGVVQYDLFKAKQEGGLLTGHLAMPPEVLLKALTKLKAKHQLRDSVVPSILDDTLKRFPKMRGKSTKDPGYTYPGAEKDRIFVPSSQHVGGADCSACPQADAIARDERNSTDPEIHYGVIASGNTLVKDAHEREFILQRLPENVRSKCLCIEMEAAGLMNTFPCVVIRGICDYADSHKNDVWQKYAAATAAAFGKELLSYVDAQEVQSAPELREAVEQGP
jgi:nucleoside phosphorylase